MSTTGEQMRAWRGLAIFSYGFRPFFFGAGLWAALAMVAWIAMLTGRLSLPTAFDPISWHAHEFLFGYLGAVIAGFLLTAVPNWTGRLPIVGWPLAFLFLLWVLGRIAVGLSALLPAAVVAALDLALPLALGVALAREIIAGKNWRNLGVLVLLGIFAFGNGVFHCEAARGEFAAQGQGLRIGLGAGLMMVALIGGRIVPSFTRNWLVRNNPGRLPVPPEQAFDKIALVVLLAAIIAWVVFPVSLATAILLGLGGILHGVRLLRWAGDRTMREPLLWVLHLGYACVPLGAILIALSSQRPSILLPAVAQHVWMAGAIGLMTLAVMTRATRGHTGRPLAADKWTTLLYLGLLGAVVSRVLAGFWPEAAMPLYAVSGIFWILAFGEFCLRYARMLLCKRDC